MNELYLNYFANSGLTYGSPPPSGGGEIVAESPALDAVPEALLLSIAEQCPLSGGKAVYRARAMYAMIDPDKTYDDEMICLSQGILYRQQKPEIAQASFRMFPNPAFAQITVNYQIAEDQRAYLLIRNSLGQALQEFTLDGKKREINFNIQALMNGIYTVQLILEGQVSHQGKLVILR